jgi:hypothetical protein
LSILGKKSRHTEKRTNTPFGRAREAMRPEILDRQKSRSLSFADMVKNTEAAKAKKMAKATAGSSDAGEEQNNIQPLSSDVV